MHKIYFLNEKGGVGKSTTALHLSGALAKDFGSTVLIDADTQQTAYRYYAMAQLALDHKNDKYEEDLAAWKAKGSKGKKPRKPPEGLRFGVIPYSVGTTTEQYEQQAGDFEYMVVDTPARINRDLLHSIMDSNSLVLIPSDTKMSDLWTTGDLVDAFRGSRATLRVIQRQGSRARAYAKEQLADEGLLELTLDSAISTLNAYEDSIFNGGTVSDMVASPSDRPMLRAISEINCLAVEVARTLEEMKRSEEATSGAATS